jgi:hypothetical protein
MKIIGVTILHHLEAELRLDALDATVKRDEAEPREMLDRVGDGPAAK